MILFILQNAYTSEKHIFTNHDEWYKELLQSHSGRRLQEMIPDGFDYRVINASGNIGTSSDSIYEADKKHICNWIAKIQPDVVCACGKIAQKGCKEMALDFIEAPHPAWRRLSKQATGEIKRRIYEQICGV